MPFRSFSSAQPTADVDIDIAYAQPFEHVRCTKPAADTCKFDEPSNVLDRSTHHGVAG